MTQKQLRELLTTKLHLLAPEFHFEKWGTKVSGSIVSQSFSGMGDADRQKKIWDALDERFGPESTHLVGMLLAFTPDEWNVKLEGHRNGHGHTIK